MVGQITEILLNFCCGINIRDKPSQPSHVSIILGSRLLGPRLSAGSLKPNCYSLGSDVLAVLAAATSSRNFPRGQPAIQTDRYNSQTDRQTHRQIGRQTDRPTYREKTDIQPDS